MASKKSQSTIAPVLTGLPAYQSRFYTSINKKTKQTGNTYDEVTERRPKAIQLKLYIQMQMVYSQKYPHYYNLLKKIVLILLRLQKIKYQEQVSSKYQISVKVTNLLGKSKKKVDFSRWLLLTYGHHQENKPESSGKKFF